MIEYQKADFNLPEIADKAKIQESLLEQYDWRVYGLRQGDDNPPIHFTYHPGEEIDNKLFEVFNFLRANNILMDLQEAENNIPKNKISIGLRKDLRDNVPLCACLLQSMIYCIEGHVKLYKGEGEIKPETAVKFKGIPEFKGV